MEASRYQVTQDGKDYILSTLIINDKIRIECQDNNFTPIPTYYKDYSLTDLNSFSEIFKLIKTIVEAQNELNNAIEQQQVKLTNKNDFMEISFTVQISNYVQEIIFQLPMRSTSPGSPVSNVSAPTITRVENEDYPDCTYSTQPNVPVKIRAPTVTAVENEDYPDCTYSTQPNVLPVKVRAPAITSVENEDYPDCTYSTQPNVPGKVRARAPTITAVENEDYPDCTYSTQPNVPNVPVQVVTQQVIQKTEQTYEFLDHDRINRIESNSGLIKEGHEQLKQLLNDLKMKIHMIKKQTGDIRKENGILNMKTLELKKQYNNLIEAEAALRTENDDLRREKHELILRKNELRFYISEPQSYDSIKEVNIPIDGKRRRPTNVSKKEKQFGGGYTSSLGYKSTSKDTKYTSTYANT